VSDGRTCPDCGNPWSEHSISLTEWETPAYRCEPPRTYAPWRDYTVLAGGVLGLIVFWAVVIMAIASALS